jgi:hypothetical protein
MADKRSSGRGFPAGVDRRCVVKRGRGNGPISEVCHWFQVVPEYPCLNARVVHDRVADEFFFEVYGDLGLYWRCRSAAPCLWDLDWKEERDMVAKWVRKAVHRVGAAKEAASVAAVAWQGEHPALHEYLTLEEGDGGEDRQTSMLCIFFEGGLFKIALQDRQEGQSLWVTAQSLPEALTALEQRLQGGDGDWRPMRADAGKNRKKR